MTDDDEPIVYDISRFRGEAGDGDDDSAFPLIRRPLARTSRTIAAGMRAFLEEPGVVRWLTSMGYVQMAASALAALREHLDHRGCELLEEWDEDYDQATYDRLARGTRQEALPFCDIVGPERVIDEVGFFAACYLGERYGLRPVAAGSWAAVLARFASWLGRAGWVPPGAAAGAAQQTKQVADTLPRAERAWDLLCQGHEGGGERVPLDRIVAYDRFAVERIEPGCVWLKGEWTSATIGPVAVGLAVSDALQCQWLVAGVILQGAAGYELHDVWAVCTELMCWG